MTGTPGLELRTLAGEVALPAASPARPRLDVSRLGVRLYQAGVDRLTQQLGQANEKVDVERMELHGEEIVVRASVEFLVRIGVEVRLTAAVTGEGCLRVEIVGIRALSWLPVPAAAAEFVLDRLKGKPGIKQVTGAAVDVDFAAALRDLKIDTLTLPPLQAVLQNEGWIELVFRAPAEQAV